MAARGRALALVVGSIAAAFVLAQGAVAGPARPAADRDAASVPTAAQDLLRAALQSRLPASLQGRVQSPALAGGDDAWATLPPSLDGRVRLGMRGSDRAGRAGWRMLDAPGSRRIELARGAAYVGPGWDVLQSVDADRLREYVVVHRHQGARTWRWQLYTARPGLAPRITDDGRVALGNGYFLEPPKLLAADLAPLDRPVRWQLDGSVLELRFDDAGLALPYVIDPDATPPEAGFVSWAESSPWAYYNGANDLNRLWFNPNQSGSATATINATDPESGVQYVRWPVPPTGWSPGASNDSSASDASGLFATYWDNAQMPGSAGCTASPQYPCTNFTGINFTRIDADVDFNWGSGTPYTELGVDTFSVRWLGKIEAPETGTYYFQTRSDDGVRLWVNGVEMASRWDDHGPAEYSGCAGGINLVAGTKYSIKMEFYENGGGAEARLRWRLPSQAGAYQTPTGCSTNVSPPRNHATGFTGGGSASYPAVPASALSTGGGNYTRTYTWTTNANGGSPTATATNNDGVTTSPFPVEWVADGAAPTVSTGTVSIQTPGWGTSANNRIDFPAAANFSDAGSSATGVGNLTRELQRKLGSSDGAGGCDTSAGSWTVISTNPTGTNITNGVTSLPTAGSCAEYRYVVRDEVGNELVMNAPGFKGWDNVNPSVTVTSLVPVTNPQYQYVSGSNLMYFNGNQSGSFTITAAPVDADSGTSYVRFYGLGTGFTPATGNLDKNAPGPYTQTFSWVSTTTDPDWENVYVVDNSTRNATATNAWRIRRDVTGPTGGTLAYGTPVWVNSLSVPVQMTATMTDALSGVKSYQLQREEVTWTAGACPAFAGPFTNIGSAVVGDPPASLGTVNDTGVVHGKCYRYRVLATDNVGNTSTSLAPVNSVRVDDVDPVATLNALPASGSGTINISGTSSDGMSGVANIAVRIENQATPGVFTQIYTTTTASPTWGPYAWNTSALNGTFNVYVDVTDNAGNVVTAVTPNGTILLDNSAPTMTFTGFTEGTNPNCQHVDPIDPTKAWFRTAGGCTGTITAAFSPADPQSGVKQLNMPGGPTGWTPATLTTVPSPGPWQLTYTWGATGVAFGPLNATATNNAGLVSANVPFSIALDNAAPTTGAISYPTTWTTTSPLTVTVSANWVDTGGSGIYQQVLRRDQVARTAANCGAGESWPGTYATTVASTVAGDPNQTLPATITDSSIATGMCYRYRLVATDNVGNTAGTSTTPTAAKTDLVAPIAAINSTPASPFSGAVSVTGTSSDGASPPASGVKQVTLRWLNLDDNVTTGTIGTTTTASPTWSIPFTSTGVIDGNYRLFVDVEDNAGNVVTAAGTRDVVVDNSPPTIQLVSFVKGSQPTCQHWTGLPSTTFWFSTTGQGCSGSSFDVNVTATDPPGGVASVGFQNLSDPTPSPATDPSAPYATTYTYTAGAGNPGGATFTATGNSGATTPLAARIVRDNAAPTGVTFTGPGAATGPGWWTTSTSVPVAFNVAGATDPAIGPDAGSGIRAGAHQLSRRETTDPACTAGWGSWGNVGPAGPTSPWTDTVQNGRCYQYRVGVSDNTSNIGWFPDTTRQLRVDTGAPTGTITALPAYVGGTSFTLTGTSGDDWSGVASIKLRIGAGPALACTPTVAASWTCTWNTTLTPDGPVTLHLDLVDVAGNTVDAATASTTVDNAVPTGSITLTPVAHPEWQYVVPGPTPKVYVNTTAAGGTFTASTTPTDPSGIADVGFPGFGVGWTPSATVVPNPGPYSITYGWTAANATAPGAVAATIHDSALNAGTAPFEVIADTAAPISGSVQYAGGPATAPAITFAAGTDPGAGIATTRIERDSAPLTGPGTCDPFPGTWTTVATNPGASPWTDGSVTLGTCYRYRLVVVDRVGNVATWTDPESDVVTVEPAGIVITESAGSTDVTEGGATDTYQVRLRTRPTANVTVTIASPDGQVSASAATLTFNTANWNVDQPVTVTAVNDDVDEVPDPHAGILTHVAASSDTDYSGLAGADVTAHVTDNDDAGIQLSPTATSVDVAEALTTSDTYTIVLKSKPTANVTIALANADAQVSVAPASVTFTPATWNAPATVTVTAVDDHRHEAAIHPGVVTHAVTSTDPLYASLTVADVTANVTDDDVPGVHVTPTTGLSLSEAAVGTTVQYDVSLDSEPSANVTINVVGDAQATPAPTTLLFTPATWNVVQHVVVTVVDDSVVEGLHSSTIAHTATSTDPDYATIPVAPVTIGITDNDVPGIEVAPTGPLAVAEGGAGATYRIRLSSQPTASVQVAFTTDAQVDPITALTFSTSDWDQWQDVDVAAVDDDVDEANPHGSTITHLVTSPDPTYAGWSLADMHVDVADDDTAGLVVDEIGGVQVDEANVAATDTFKVHLASRPTAPITVTITPDSQTTTTTTLTFAPATWDTDQLVTVTAVDDDVDEGGPHPSTIALTAAGDPQYATVTHAPVTATVLDDDHAGVVVSPGTLALDETAPATDTYTVELASEPISNVTVTVAPDSQVATPDTTLTFTPATWDTAQTVHVTAVDDPTVEDTPHPGQLTHAITTTDPAYAGITPTAKDAAIDDNDSPGVVVTTGAGVEATEGGADGSYTIELARQPATGETVTIDLAGDPQVTPNPTQLVFDHGNWNVARTVTVEAVDDHVDEPDPHPGIVTHTVSSTDPRWSTVTAAPVNVSVHDDDVAQVVVTHASPYALAEATPAATVGYDVQLATEPTSNVTITLTVPGDLHATATTLTFTPADWDQAQTVTVNAIDDAVVEAPIHTRTITHAIASGDLAYAPLTMPDMVFDVTDNDIPGITVSRSSLAVTEGGATDTFTVVLATQPTADVTVDLTGTQVGFDAPSFTFTTSNWNIPHTVVVSAVQDDIDETPNPHAGLVELAVHSTDLVYDFWPLTDVPVDVTDDDAAGVLVTPGSTPIAVDENGPTSATYDVVLESEPTGPVTVALAPDAQVTTGVPSLTFTPADWDTVQHVTVTAVDDDVDEAPTHPGTVVHTVTSADTHYAGIATDDQLVDVADDDDSGVSVTPTTLALDEAAPGTTATFDVVLTSKPPVDVDVTFATPDGQTTVAPSITFTPADWDTIRQVVVTVVDDDVDETTPHLATIVTGTTSTDPAYDAVDPADVDVTIADDDAAGVQVVETGGSTDVDEAGVTDTYAISLTSKPVAPVTITITGGSEASVDTPIVTIAPADWDQPHVVTVSGTPDSRVEGLHTQTFTHAASSVDPNYQGVAVTIPDVIAHITDDDAAGVSITPTSLTATEGGTGDSYDVQLTAEPDAPVTVTITPDAQVTVDHATLTFTPGDWDSPQTVAVTAFNDLVTEPTTHPGVITHATASADTDFASLPASDVTVAITDDDDPGVIVTPTSTTASEDGATGSFDVKLDSDPGQPVDVTFTEPGQLDPIATVTFTSADWDQVKTITVHAHDDQVEEGPHPTTITIDTSSAAPAYASGALTIDPVHVDITDNDHSGVLLAPSSGLAGTEGGLVHYQLSLTSEPRGTVTITLAGDADGTPAQTTYTFDALTWATPQDVDVTLVEDDIAEGLHDTTISGTIGAPADSFYAAIGVPDQVIAITDNDSAGVTFTPALPGPLSIAEGGATATYDLELTSEPTGTVTIDLLALAGQATASPATVSFDASDWDSPHTVTITAVDDDVAETDPHTDKMAHVAGGADPVYAALPIGDMDLSIADDDTASVLVTATGADTAVTEGGATDTVDVRLGSKPTAAVTVTLTGVQVDLAPATLTFDQTNWDQVQQVTVTAIQDDVAEGIHPGTIDAATTSVDPFYVGLAAAQLPVTITDDDTAGVVVTQPTATDLDESHATVGQPYQIRLHSKPIAPVDVVVNPGSQLTTSPSTLTFTPADWDQDQTVTAYPVDDAVAEASPHTGTTSHDTTSTDPAYAAGTLTIDTVDFAIADNDSPGIVITPTSGHVVAEDGSVTSTYTVVLHSQPTGTVTLAPVSTQLEWSVPDITFTTTDWDQEQTITLRAIDDRVDEPDTHPGTLDMTVTSTDVAYATIDPDDVTATITDNDDSLLLATPASGLALDEAGTLPPASYVLTLSSIPSAPVTVTLVPDAQVTPDTATVTLDATNWDTGVTVHVTAVDDHIDEASTHLGTIAHTLASADPNYAATATGPDVTADILDDDDASVSILPTGADTTVAEDGSIEDDYDVVLGSEPIAPVTIDLTQGSQLVVAPATLTFTPGNWDQLQRVHVTAFDDRRIEHAHTGTVTHAATSADTAYAGITIDDLVANVLDDDTAGLVVAPAGAAFEVTEGGAGDTVNVQLASEPAAPVTVTLAVDAQLAVGSPSIVLDSTNWDTGIDVPVDAVDDGYIEANPHPGVLTLAIDPASDPEYLAVTPVPVTADVYDNDSAAVLVDELDGVSLDEADAATTDRFQVRLQAAPAPGKTVTVDLAEAAPGGQVTFAPSTLTFDDGSWDQPVDVVVTVVDDHLDEADPHAQAITIGTTSDDPAFDNLGVADVDVAIADDDETGIVLDTAAVSVDEAGPTSATVTVHLASKPYGPVELALAWDPTQVDVSPGGPLTFTPGDWDSDQTITITAVDDDLHEATPHHATLTITPASVGASDPAYDALAPRDVDVAIDDDDPVGIDANVAAGTDVDEHDASRTVTWDVRLTSEPHAPVTVTATVDAQLELVGGGTLTFTPADWQTPQQVEVRAHDDDVDETDPHDGSIQLAATGADTDYAALAPSTRLVDVRDDDDAGLVVTQAPVPQLLAEDGSIPSATYTVQLASRPTDVVTIALTPDPQVELVGPAQVDIDPADWDQPHPIAVRAHDDLVTEPSPHAGQVTHATDSLDPAYAAAANLTGAAADFAITDDDDAGITVTPATAPLSVDEGDLAATTSFDVRIDSIPAGTVTVDLTTGGDATVTPSTLTFDAANAADAQTVTVAAFDDHLVEGPETDQVQFAITAAVGDPYATVTVADLPVDVADDDAAGVLVDAGDGVSVDEHGTTTDTFAIALTAEPTSTVTVDLAADPAQLEPTSPTTLTFTPGDWDQPQQVTVTPIDDHVVEGPHTAPVAIATSSTDADFDTLTVPAQSVSIADDDLAGVVVTAPADLTMDEADVPGSTRTVHVALRSQPVVPVTVNVGTNGQVSLATAVLVLDSSNWDTGIDVDVALVQDTVAEASPHDGTLTFAVDPLSDAAYQGLVIDPLTFAIADDDAPGLTCDPGSDWNLNGAGHLDLAEDPAAATHDVSCTIQLQSASTADVTVAISAAPASQLAIAPASVTIPAGTTGPVPVTITAVDDDVAEGTHAARIEFDVQSTDPLFDILTLPAVDADIADNDAAGVVVTPSGPIALAEGGASQTATVALTSEPTAPVTIQLDGGAQVGVTPATLTFQPSSWQSVQTITLSAIDDHVDEPDPHPGQVAFDAASADAAYDSATITPLDATIADNDVPGVVVTTTDSGNAVTEGGATDTISLRLGTEPTSYVTVTVAGDAQVGTDPTTVRFAPTDWEIPKEVKLTAVQDQVVEGTHQANVTFTLDSLDPIYAAGTASTPASQPVTVTDDDTAGITIVQSDSTTKVEEGGATDTYTVQLSGQPTADVQIAIGGGGQVTTAPEALSFTPADWNVAQTVTVTAIQDSVDEPNPHPGEITHTATTTAAGWADARLLGITASIADDDSAEIVMGQTDDSTTVTEGEAQGDMVTFRLASQPTADVTITPVPDEQLDVPVTPITLGPDRWRDPVSLAVKAVDDEDVEGDHEGVLKFTVKSDDPSYATATVSTLTVPITDNDTDSDEPLDDGTTDETTDRAPRSSVPPATVKPGTNRDRNGETTTRRSSEGESRTPVGRVRLPEGTGGAAQDEGGVRRGTRLGGEIVASKENGEATRKGPLAAATAWLGNHWKLWLPLLVGAVLAIGTLSYLMRSSDPARAATRASSRAARSAAKQAGAGKGHRPHPRRGRKRDDDDDEDEQDRDGSGSPRRR